MLLFILVFLLQYARKKSIPNSKWSSHLLEIGTFENHIYTLLSFDLPLQMSKMVRYHHTGLEKLMFLYHQKITLANFFFSILQWAQDVETFAK